MLDRVSATPWLLGKLLTGAMLLTLLQPAIGLAQSYPAKPVRVVVPYPTGGNADLLSRIMVERLSEALKQQFLADNRPGANGVIGADVVAKSPPDGYTLAFVAAGHTINPAVYEKMPFDAAADFTAIGLVGATPLIIAVSASLPVENLKELIALAKAKPGQLNYASPGNGSPGHLAGALFNSVTGVQMAHVPYKGAALAMPDLISGRVQVMFPTTSAVLSTIKQGKVKGLAITGNQRSPQAPDIMTFKEAGLATYDSATWTGFVGPARIPQPIVERLNQNITAVVKSPSVKERFIALGADPMSSTPEEFSALLVSEVQKWTRVVKEAGVKMD